MINMKKQKKRGFHGFSERIFSGRHILLFLIAVNMAGFLLGVYNYYGRLAESPPYLWPIIADCPVAVLLFSIVCYLFYSERKVPNLLVFLTSVYTIKYGIWTLSAIVLYWPLYTSSGGQIIGSLNFAMHCGLILEGVVLSAKISHKIRDMLIVTIILIANDYFDYFLGTLPDIPGTHVGFLLAESFAVSLILPVLIFTILHLTRDRKYRQG
jgi:uncharacterized membrane protein YpjA